MERIFSLSSRSTYFFFLDFSHVKCINLLNNCNCLSILAVKIRKGGENMLKKSLRKVELKKKVDSKIHLYTNGDESCCNGDLGCCNKRCG